MFEAGLQRKPQKLMPSQRKGRNQESRRLGKVLRGVLKDRAKRFRDQKRETETHQKVE